MIPLRYVRPSDCYLKCEYMNPSGSHKDRETFRILNHYGFERDYVCATTGNAGISLAYFINRQAHIVVPKTCPKEKLNILQRLGANIILVGKTYEDAWKYARVLEIENAWLNISPGIEKMRADADMQIAIEISKQLIGTDYTVFVPSANHTLAYGIWKGFNGKVKVVSVVLPNHPFLCNPVKLTPEQLHGFESINTAYVAMDKRWLKLPNTAIETVDPQQLESIKKDGFLDPCVYLALTVSKKYKGRKIVIATGVRR